MPSAGPSPEVAALAFGTVLSSIIALVIAVPIAFNVVPLADYAKSRGEERVAIGADARSREMDMRESLLKAAEKRRAELWRRIVGGRGGAT